MTQTELLKLLSSGVVQVTFTKKDGTNRIMKCTRDLALVPVNKHPKTELINNETLDRITAYDIEANDWRSFMFSSCSNFS